MARLPRCPVNGCPIRYRDGEDRLCALHRREWDLDVQLTETLSAVGGMNRQAGMTSE